MTECVSWVSRKDLEYRSLQTDPNSLPGHGMHADSREILGRICFEASFWCLSDLFYTSLVIWSMKIVLLENRVHVTCDFRGFCVTQIAHRCQHHKWLLSIICQQGLEIVICWESSWFSQENGGKWGKKAAWNQQVSQEFPGVFALWTERLNTATSDDLVLKCSSFWLSLMAIGRLNQLQIMQEILQP